MSEIQKNQLKVAVGLSGGVDSAVCAKLLLDQGYDVTGVFIQCWDSNNPDYLNSCSAEEDRAHAISVASHLNIRLIHLDFVEEYKTKVLSYFYSEYKAGRTPNPDVVCNKIIKFGLFYDWCMAKGYSHIATGHYARIKNQNGLDWQLLTGVDIKKDQSYFLYELSQDKLAHILFPLGELLKTDVRKIAKESALPNWDRPDSVGICFVGDIPLKDFISHEVPISDGCVINKAGEVIGKHKGIHFYTVGQRHGFDVNLYQGQALYVLKKIKASNTLIVGTKEDAYTDKFEISNLHFVNAQATAFECNIRIRHLGGLIPAEVSIKGDMAYINLKSKAFAVAEGQSAVFYSGDTVIGGGVISVASY